MSRQVVPEANPPELSLGPAEEPPAEGAKQWGVKEKPPPVRCLIAMNKDLQNVADCLGPKDFFAGKTVTFGDFSMFHSLLNIQNVFGSQEFQDESIKSCEYSTLEITNYYDEKGLDYLISLGIHSVNIIWANGQRTDHVLNNYSSYIKYKKDFAKWTNRDVPQFMEA